ncbi:MAG: DNA polymerase IV [Candidatus Peribacter sp.]|jgi:nucleotidyltransferase/DNA polymerase involved in DNA repair|nr:DNA polymerase IV [Candidatus Peribacter sp.]MBT4393379.1 DNA polymerase IV [Candidatus Peribacter sp.]MBT4600782.1 DNA polymerase IV [Candidatus Peribacter sp.]MBT5149172.1 DNA polymerase IV [Candidatus Peribacter sp.]MBT5637855.1 DNA polymerase IV [Candidatus Peribacter sp.]
MIAHIDADAFFASALQRKRPDLVGKPLLALGMGGGCVIAASYEAKAKGVKTGMRLSEARKLCRGAIALPSDFDEALLASRQIEQILKNRCPIIQRYSVDEWFLDLKSLPGGLPDNVKYWALELQETVKKSVGLTVSIGIGTSKLLAKMASEYVKPEGVTIVWPTTVDTFLSDRQCAAIPGIGKRRELHTAAQGWKTAFDIAHADKETVQKLLGRLGLAMQRELLGEMVEKVETEIAPPKSISRTRSFLPTRDLDMVYAHLLHHLTYTMLKMRRAGLACGVVSVWLRSASYTFDQKESKLPQAADTEEQVLPYIHQCFERLYEQGNSYTQVGLGLHGLNPKGGTQFSLFESPKHTKEAENIQEAMDNLHKKYGRESVKRGAAMAVTSAKKPHLGTI